MKKLLPIMIIVSALALVGFACTKEEENTNTTTNTVVNTNRNTNTTVNANSSVNANRNTNSIANTNEDENVNENTNESEDENENVNTNTNTSSTLKVTSPERNEELDSAFAVEGTSSADKVYVRVKNAGGVALFTETVTVREGEYHINLTVELTHTASGSIEVYEKTAAGAETNLVSVPVSFKVETEDTNTNSNVNTNTNANTNSY